MVRNRCLNQLISAATTSQDNAHIKALYQLIHIHKKTSFRSNINLFQSSLGAIEPIMCPLGYKEYDGAPRATFEDTCEPCKPGTFGAHASRAVCEACRAGVVCQAIATTDQPVANSSSIANLFGPNVTNSYLCPAGNFCVKPGIFFSLIGT